MPDLRLAWALVAVVVRYVVTIRGDAKREIARWKRRAHAIPDPELRARVLLPFRSDLSIEGAAVFAVLSPRRSRDLVKLLIAYVVLWSYIDALAERDGDKPTDYALVRALDPGRPIPTDEFGSMDDGGYLMDLVAVCRSSCARLPAWRLVQVAVLALAQVGRVVQAANHGPAQAVESELRGWAAERFPDPDSRWFELCAAASGPLALHALMTVAAAPCATPLDVAAVASAYFPAVSALSVLSDHLIDAQRDAATDEHSYLAYYDSPSEITAGLERLTAAATRDLGALRDGNRHVVIFAAMVAMFYSDAAAWRPENAATSNAVLDAAGWPARSLLAMMRAIRRLDGERPDPHGEAE